MGAAFDTIGRQVELEPGQDCPEVAYASFQLKLEGGVRKMGRRQGCRQIYCTGVAHSQTRMVAASGRLSPNVMRQCSPR